MFNTSTGAIEDKIIFHGWFDNFNEMMAHAQQLTPWDVLIVKDSGRQLYLQGVTMYELSGGRSNFEFLGV